MRRWLEVFTDEEILIMRDTFGTAAPARSRSWPSTGLGWE